MKKDLSPALAVLRSRRALLDLTQEQLASKAGISKQTCCEIEKGSQRPNRSTLFGLCSSLNLPSSDRDRLFRAFGHSPVTELDAVGLHIKSLRTGAGLSQSQMASKISSTRALVSKAEMGMKVVVTIAPLVYDFFEVNEAERMSYEDNQHQEDKNLGNPDSKG